MSGTALDTLPSLAAIEPEEVARALSGLSDAVMENMTRLAQRCERAERELSELRGSRAPVPDERAALHERIRELEERLEAEGRLSRLGAMAGGIAHEIRNPLHAARGFAELLERHMPKDAHERRWAARIIEAVDEVEEIATSLLSIASRQPLTRQPVDPVELVTTAIVSARRALDGRGKPERWVVTRSVDAPHFAGDRTKLRSALRNLVANALQALPEGGRVEVHAGLDAGDVCFSVLDSGPGVPGHLQHRVDEPFFTTRSGGTGLGLVLVRAIAELHGGRFEVSNAPGPLGGAKTDLRIPFEPR
jgi:signal transduction histidine kinase